jgi:hypothetical protein
MLNPWLALTFKAMRVGIDAQNVIFLRMMRLSAGGARGQSEAARMVIEKIAASVEVRATAVSGMITGRKDTVVAAQVLRGLRKRVRANKRRLSRKWRDNTNSVYSDAAPMAAGQAVFLEWAAAALRGA